MLNRSLGRVILALQHQPNEMTYLRIMWMAGSVILLTDGIAKGQTNLIHVALGLLVGQIVLDAVLHTIQGDENL